MFTINALPYDKNALSGFLSENTLSFHHDKHLQAYVDNTNNLAKGTPFEGEDLTTIIKKATGGLFNNAAQVFNHEFYFKCLSADVKAPNGRVKELLLKNFETLENFESEFSKAAVSNFGSGWTWLVQTGDTLKIVNTSNAQNPLTEDLNPILCVDVWEHAYYLDYQNRRADYIKAFLSHINWDFVESNLK